MKRCITLFLAAAMAFYFTACGSEGMGGTAGAEMPGIQLARQQHFDGMAFYPEN